MTEKLKQQLNEQMEFIPKESQEAINSFDWEKISEEIGKKYFFTEDDMDIFQADIGLVLVGLAEQEYLADDIEDDVYVSKDKAQKITEEIIEKIFKPIYENLVKNIKNKINMMPAHWQQNLDFILSGGDYTAFIRRVENPTSDKAIVGERKENTGFSKFDDLKSKFTI